MPFVYDPAQRKYVYTNGASTGTSVAAGRLNPPAAPLPATETKKKSGGGLLGRLVNPLVDLPDQKNPVLRFLETGIEQSSSPIGLASMALLPVTGGTSLGLTGALGVGARVGTRVAAEVAVSAAASKAAEEAGKKAKNLPGPLPTIAAIGAGALAGGVSSKGINTALGVKSVAGTRLQQLKKADAGMSVTSFTAGHDKLAYLLRNTDLVTGTNAATISNATGAAEKRFGEILKANNFSQTGYKMARASLSKPPRNIRFQPAGITQPAALRSPGAQLTGTDIRDMFRTIKRNVTNPLDQYKAVAVLEDVTARGIKPSGSEMRILQKAFGDDFALSLDALQTKGQAFRQYFFDVLGLPRTIQASFDLSAPLRQGIMLAPGHPVKFAKAIGPMFRSFFDEDYAKKVLDDLQVHPGFKDFVDSGGEFTGFSGYSFRKSEEQFANRLFDTKLSGTALGAGVKASERAYTVFLNKLRLDVFHSLTKNWSGTPKSAYFEEIATMVNNMTGRAKIPGQSVADGKLLNAIAFAPKFVYSRFAAPIQLLTAPPEVRKQIAKELGSFVGTGMMVMYLAHKAGADIDINPTSSDFGKVKVGNTRYDFWGGYSQIARAVAQTVTGQYTASNNQTYDANRAETVGKFLQSKLAPVPGLTIDVLRGETFTGEEITADPAFMSTQLANRVAPLFLQDVVESMQTDGLEGALKTLPAGLGLGAQTYTSLRDEQNVVAQEMFKKNYRDLTAVNQDIVNSDPRVVTQATKQAARGNDYGDTVIQLNENRVQGERILAASLVNGTLDPKDFADAISQLQRDTRVAKDQAAKDFGVKFPPPDSPLQQALDSYYNLFDKADYGWNEANPAASVKTGAINWEVFDELEHNFYASLTPEQREYVDGRRTAEHPDPLVKKFFDDKKLISDSGYYDTIDAAFNKQKRYVQSFVKGAETYGDLLQAMNIARNQQNIREYNRLKKVANKISAKASEEKEKLRKKNQELDLALFNTGRTSTFLNSRNKRLTTN